MSPPRSARSRSRDTGNARDTGDASNASDAGYALNTGFSEGVLSTVCVKV